MDGKKIFEWNKPNKNNINEENKNDDEKENEVINSNKIIKKLHAELSII